jgi:putative membrane protein
MMRTNWAIVIAVFSAPACAIAAQAATQNTGSIGNPAGLAPNTPGVFEGRPDTRQPNTADVLFAHEASIGGQGEIQAAKLAARKAQSQAVKDFANRMVNEHSAAAERLSSLLKGGAYPASTRLDDEHRVMLEQLGKANGKSFDELYIRGQIVDHQKSVQLYEWIIGNGEDARLQGYAMDVLPAVMQHLEIAKGILSELTGSAP